MKLEDEAIMKLLLVNDKKWVMLVQVKWEDDVVLNIFKSFLVSCFFFFLVCSFSFRCFFFYSFSFNFPGLLFWFFFFFDVRVSWDIQHSVFGLFTSTGGTGCYFGLFLLVLFVWPFFLLSFFFEVGDKMISEIVLWN